MACLTCFDQGNRGILQFQVPWEANTHTRHIHRECSVWRVKQKKEAEATTQTTTWVCMKPPLAYVHATGIIYFCTMCLLINRLLEFPDKTW